MSWWRGGLSGKWKKYWITRKWIFDMHFVATFYSCLSILTSLRFVISSNADTAAGCWQAPEHKVHVCGGWIHKTRQAVTFPDVSVSLQRHYDSTVHGKDFKSEIQKHQSTLLNSVGRCCCPKSSSSNLRLQVLFSSSCLGILAVLPLCKKVTAQPSPHVAHPSLLIPLSWNFSDSSLTFAWS